MSIIQLLLILVGLAVAAGGAAMLLRGANQETSGNNVPRPYLTLGIMAVGLVIIYMAFSDYQSMDIVEVIGLFLFGLAFGSALALKLFVVDRFDFSAGRSEPSPGEVREVSNNADKDAEGETS